METERNKAVVQRWIAALNARDLQAAYDCFAADHRDGYAGPEQTVGPAGVVERVQRLLSALDLRFEIEELVAEGDCVAARLTARGVHRDNYRGIPATGRPVQLTWASFAHLSEGKIIRSWGIFNALDLIEQIGASVRPPLARDQA